MLGGISIWQLLIVLGIIILIFGTKKLRNVGSDLGGAVKGFKKAVSEEEEKKGESDSQAQVRHDENTDSTGSHTYDVEAERKPESSDERK
ncbi:Sec-independent protein translocase subunit TatA [Halomonas huangheensis]|uniref:Sec-independent protein translocase protein TatA n=1 Tax=Halomonas huangheensis TaxID=1178482 RepID=W1N2U7_9GAMM|nr:Sec-independent protein translocase subunit TatA [Halomonas huangheensis]ALM51373.1 preprotein translocase subunit TatA [Halomonas huangheensis]ERL49813.1 hypothetical protein BJB45_01450 [Halomonas huangheensis]